MTSSKCNSSGVNFFKSIGQSSAGFNCTCSWPSRAFSWRIPYRATPNHSGQVAVVDRLRITEHTSFHAIHSPSAMDLDLIYLTIVVSSPNIVITTPTTIVTIYQRVTCFEFFLKPENSDLDSPTLILNFKKINIINSVQITSSKLNLTLISSKQIVNSLRINANKFTEYF